MPSEQEIESMVVRLKGDGSGYEKMLKKAQSQTNMTDGHIQLATKRIQAFGMSLRGYGASAVAMVLPLVGAAGALASAWKGVRLAAEMEQMKISFEVLTGSAQLARLTLEDLTTFANETPFEMPEVVAAAKQMMAFGSTANEIVPTMRSLGDVASGLNIPLGQLTYLFGTLKSQGRAMTVDINQFAMRGIPIWKELGKVMFNDANAVNKVRDAVEHGKVSFDHVEKAFNNMTKAGGRFGGMMQRQSESAKGLFSTMQDSINGVLREIGQDLIDGLRLKDMMKGVIEFGGVALGWWKRMSAGISQAFNFARTQALKFWAEIQPVWNSALSKLMVMWERVRKSAESVWGWITKITQKYSREVRAVAMAIGIMLTVWATMKIAIIAVTLATKIWGAVLGVASGGFTLLTGLLVTAVVLIGAWVAELGWVQEAWEHVKEKGTVAWERIKAGAMAFAVWFTPIWNALVSLATSEWNRLTEAASVGWDKMKQAFIYVRDLIEVLWGDFTNWMAEQFGMAGGKMELTWEKVKNFFVIGIYALEYAFQNLPKIADLAWAGIKLGGVTMFEDIKYWFTVMLPAFGLMAFNVLKTHFTNIWTMGKNIFLKIGSNLIEMGKNLPKLLKGEMKMSDIWKDFDVTKGMEKIPLDFDVPKRIPSELETKLRAEFEAKGGALGESFAEFLDRKLMEGAPGPDGTPDPADPDSGLGSFFNKMSKYADISEKKVGEDLEKTKNHIQKFDGALTGSAEALARIADYRQGLEDIGQKKAVGSGKHNIWERMNAGEFTSDDQAKAREEAKQAEYLKGILGEMIKQNAKKDGSIVFEVAELS